MLADVHRVVRIAIVEHALGDGGGGVFSVGQHTNLRGMLDESTVELRPGAACQRDNAQVVVGQQQSVGQHLQGVERRVEHDFCFRHLPADGVGKAEEERVARGKDNKRAIPLLFPHRDGPLVGLVLLKHFIQRHRDVYPLCIGRQQRAYYLVVALAAREHVTAADDVEHFRREKRLWIVTYANNNKLHLFVHSSQQFTRL